MKRPAIAAAALLLTAPSALAEVPPAPPPGNTFSEKSFSEQLERAERLAVDGVQKLLDSARLLLDAVPRYEMPQMTENGDIIIRRKPPEPREPAPPRGKAI